MDWQPIETAPKDGTAILLYGGEGAFGWSPPSNMVNLPISISFWQAAGGVEPDWVEPGWVEATGEQHETHIGPTHWAPLPDPPA